MTSGKPVPGRVLEWRAPAGPGIESPNAAVRALLSGPQHRASIVLAMPDHLYTQLKQSLSKDAMFYTL